MRTSISLAGLVWLAACSSAFAAPAKVELLNASYDVSRELFSEINPAFQAVWRAKTAQDVAVRQSHGGSSKQARSVAEGLQADVVTFNQATDIDFLVRTGLVARNWASRLPNGASPYYSLPVFMVRAGNPKGIKDWDDLARSGVEPVFPNPKTSGNGRYTYLSAYAFALGHHSNDPDKAKALVGAILKNVPVFDTGGRGAATTFVERRIGDVLVTFESEVGSIRREYEKAGLQVIYPSTGIRVDFPVAVVDKVVARHGTAEVARAYLQFLYSAEGQGILAKHFNRVHDEAVARRYVSQFPDVHLVSVDEAFGGWDKVTKTHFADGGVLDQILAANR